MDNESLLKNKIMDAANRSFRQNIYTYTNFLDINEQSVFAQMKNALNFAAFKTYGGNDACERQMVQFGSYETLGYEEEFPIALIKISPLIEKYAESLSHRDYLGALMNLGIKREMLGDINIKGKDAYVYCVSHIADFIIDNLSTVKHTHIQCTKTDINDIECSPELEDIEVLSASERIDAAVASLTKLSRSQAVELFRARKIFINSRQMENNSYQLKANDILVIRGTGKFIYQGCGRETKKGRIYLSFKKYV